jgi:hypothetical protein
MIRHGWVSFGIEIGQGGVLDRMPDYSTPPPGRAICCGRSAFGLLLLLVFVSLFVSLLAFPATP